ncbi:NADPH-dependent FMN reductase [Aquariibacter albus]|uniref:NADPH-dependent FMN reductase n=1 Tax=Aquariibacter albus TaxID=2759899 RepID=A0A839HW09_9BURK|nr:NADPH-dependent FMN reductase [Aquariibacter albus]MBB1162854.1 NADPH-dependent FMN reductase [Aquariibacter albus]
MSSSLPPLRIVGLSGSPSNRSRSAWLLQLALTRLESRALRIDNVPIRELPPAALLAGDLDDAPLRRALGVVAESDLLVIATPIYKASASGLLKVFLDLLPQDGLRGKTVLPLATGGSLAHLLALDWSLRPVLAALGVRHILDTVYATEAQLPPHAAGGYLPDPALLVRLDEALQPLRAPARTPPVLSPLR